MQENNRYRSLEPPDETASTGFINNRTSTEFSGSGIDEKLIVQSMKKQNPMPMSGKQIIDGNRKVLWRQNYYIGMDNDQSIVEVSKTKNKLYIVAFNTGTKKYSVIELFRFVARKLMFSLD